MDYRAATAELWRHHDPAQSPDLATTLIRYATMAASSHNTQPWRFRPGPGRISILPDLERRCPQVDPDDHHLWASLGCAATNLLEAAAAAGRHGRLSVTDTAVEIDFEEGTPSRSAMFDAIPARQCSRAAYDGSGVSAQELEQLQAAGSGDGVSVLMLTAPGQMEAVAEYVAEGNAAQIADPAWARELRGWIRFNQRRAVTSGDGLYGASSGNPDVPSWLGRLVLRFALTPKRQSAKDREAILSSGGVAVFVSDADDRAHWVEAGRCYERFALTATSLGLRNAFINPPVEVPGLRDQFASWLGVGARRPDLIVRFGHGPEMPRSLRRPVAEVLV